jgi:hypothetical protein
MRRAVAAVAASVALLLTLSAPAAAQRPGGRASSFPLLDVPYLSQGELLCGGAAAAMLIRALGTRGVYAEDFQSLVDRSAGGIHTRALAEALRARGYVVNVFHGSAPLAQQLLAGGRPVLSLIQDRPGRFHYVVIVGWSGGRVVFHDPARAPFAEKSEADFDRAWAPAERWMLVLDRREDANEGDAVDSPELPGSTERDAAAARFLERDYHEAAKLASQAITLDPKDRIAWRLLGASRYLSGEPGRALDAWNQAGDPKIDLIRIEGLGRTPHRAAEGLIELSPGTVLTRAILVRADRRLALLPAREVSRVSYVALPGNLVEVRGAVVERSMYPSGLEWMVALARVAVNREISVPLVNVAHSGDRLTAVWRFWEGRPRADLSFAFPTPRVGGVARMSVSWQEEHYAETPATERREAVAAWTNWMTPRLRVSLGGGFAQWARLGRAALLQAGAEFRPVSDRVSLDLSTTSAVGTMRPFAAVSASVRWRDDFGAFHLLGTHTAARASHDAPLDQWPGAGSGIARPLLLRAHPLVDDGRVAGAAFGRTLAHSSVELERDIARKGFAVLGVATFADVARAWNRPDGSGSPVHVDVGAGVRLRLGPGQPAIRIDVAHGLRDGDTALSAGWQVRM